MTVVLVSSIARYIGLSTDSKPTPPAGSTFYETDTGLTYIYDGSAWQVGPEGSPWRLTRRQYSFAVDGGTQVARTMFTVTGNVQLQVVGICATGPTSGGAATIELGVTGNTAVFIAQTTATDLLDNEIWHDATPTTTVEAIDFDGTKTFTVSNGQDISFLIGGANLTAGIINFYVLWRPLSANGLVVAA